MYTIKKYSRYSTGAIKLLYFMLYMGMASWSTYLYVFLEQERHLSGTEIGVIAAIQQINNLIILPIWGMVSDRFGKRKIFLILLALSSFFIIGFIYNGNFLFYVFFILFFTAMYNPLASLADSLALEKVNESVIHSSYGNMRLWASLGWAVSSVVTSQVVKHTSVSVIFPLTTAFFIITWIIGFVSLNKKHEHKTTQRPSLKILYTLLMQNKKLFYFFCLCSLYYICNSGTLNIINLYYTEIGAPNFMIGIAFAVQSVSELPFMFFAAKIIQKIGTKNVIFLTMFTAAVRMFLYGIITNPVYAIGVGCLHGITLGLFMVAAISFVHQIIPPEYNSTGQTLFNTFLAIGTSLGNLLNGYMNDTISLAVGMRINALAVIFLMILGILFSKYLNFKSRKNSD